MSQKIKTSVEIDGSLTANSIVKSGGTASQILAADGSVVTAGSGVTISGGTISASGSAGVLSFNTRTGAVTLTSGDVTTALGYTPYNASNPAGYISSYTETDTLATVTGRGNTANTSIAVRNSISINKSDGSSGGQLSYDSSINQLYLWNSLSSGYFSIYTNNSERFKITSGGSVISVVEHQSPIYYDYNDTSYYVNPNGDSRLYRTYIGNYTNWMTLGAWDGVNNRIEAVGQPLFLTSYGGSIKFGYQGSSQMELSTAGNLTVSGTLSASGYNKTNWDTAFGWGNHASAGYALANHTHIISPVAEASISPNGISIQAGPGSSNTQGWTYPYGTKLSAITGAGRSFEIMSTTYPDGQLVLRTLGSGGTWDSWKTILDTSNYSTYAVPSSRTITINGTSYDLSANRSWTVTASETDTLATVTSRGASTSTLSTFDGGLNIGNAKLRWGGTTTPTLGFPFSSAGALWLEVNDGDTGGIAIDNDGTTVFGAGDNGYVFRVIDEDVYQGNSNVTASTTFQVSQGANGGGYMRGIFNVTDYLIADNSARSPIFYDSNDTGYYWNPATDASHRFQTPYGYIDIGPKNSSYCHIYTDRGSFYFNAEIDMLGNRVLHAGNYSNYVWPLQGSWKPASLASSTRLRGATSPDGGEFALAYSGGQIHPYADGFFYQNEGAYRVMDSNSIGDYTVGNYRTIADYSSDSTWYMRPNGRFVFANAHDWTQSFELFLPSGGSNNNTWAHFGQRHSNATNGNFTGVSIRRYISGASNLGDLQAGNVYGRIFYDDDNTSYYLNPASLSNVNSIAAGNYIFANAYLETNGPVYGTIFYDNNNRSYYCDPSATSNFIGLTVANTINGNISGNANTSNTDYLMSGRDFPNGTLIQTSINYNNSEGDPFILEIKGNSYGNGMPMDVQIQGYIYANTIINTGGYSNGFNVSGIRAIRYNGNLCFWFPTQGYWNGYTVKAYTAYEGRQVNKVTSVTNTGLPTTDKQVNFTPAISLRSDNYRGYSDFSGAVYGTIYYDANNTGYYVHPASTSNLNAINFSTLYSNRSGASGNVITIDNAGSSTWPFIFQTSAVGNDNSSGFWTSNLGYPDMRLRKDDGNVRALISSWERSYTTYGLSDDTDMRAPIFYDNNNTGYYVDPASTSNFNAANFAGSVNLFGGYGPGSGPGLGFENQNSFIRLAFWGMDFYDWNHGIQMVIDNGYVSANNSFRAPTFYDSNNTGYYLDPASTSNLNLLTMANKITLGSFPNSTTNNGEAWIGRAADRSAGTMTVQLGGNLDRKFEVVDYGWTTVNFSVNGYGAAEASGSMRAPIFYDNNNTGYYVDPASTSSMYEANFGDNSSGNQGINIYYGNQTGGYGKIRFYQSGSNHQTIHSFSANWQGGGFGSGNSANAINIDGAAGVTFGGWNVPDAYIAKGGNFWCRYDVIAYSDARVKDNVEIITNALDKIKKVRGVTFTRNDYEDKEKRHTGVIAQEMLEALPEAVTKDSDGMYSVSYGNLAGLFIEAIKEQQTQIEELKELVNKLINK